MKSIGKNWPEVTDIDLEKVMELDTNDNGKLEKDEVGDDYFLGSGWPFGPAGFSQNIFHEQIKIFSIERFSKIFLKYFERCARTSSYTTSCRVTRWRWLQLWECLCHKS